MTLAVHFSSLASAGVRCPQTSFSVRRRRRRENAFEKFQPVGWSFNRLSRCILNVANKLQNVADVFFSHSLYRNFMF